MAEEPERQLAMRGGLAWLDRECVTRFDKTFLNCAAAERTQVLDAIAWPQKAAPELSHGVAFFNSFRDLTASGFWTSRIGMKDIAYMGNVYVPMDGCRTNRELLVSVPVEHLPAPHPLVGPVQLQYGPATGEWTPPSPADTASSTHRRDREHARPNSVSAIDP